MNVSEIKDPVISVDRASKRVAAFDGTEILHKFVSYENEESAIASMSVWLAMRMPPKSPNWPPKVVYPRITKLRMSS